MNHHDAQYHGLLSRVLKNGNEKEDRTGTGTRSIFGAQLRFNLRESFPLITTKKIHWHSVVHELLWFISGSTNIKYLKDNKVRIWDEWADDNGELGRVYGAQWRDWKGSDQVSYDQIKRVVERIKTNPDCRRMIVTAWNPAEIHKMALPPCHMTFQFYVCNGELSCHMLQRSADLFLGVPFNIASYSLLTLMVAHACDLKPGDFIHSLGDAHIYKNHFGQVEEQLGRKSFDPPLVVIDSREKDLFSMTTRDISLVYYDHHPAIKAKVSV